MAAASSWKIKFPRFEKGGSATLRLARRLRRCLRVSPPGELLTKSRVERMGLSSQHRPTGVLTLGTVYDGSLWYTDNKLEMEQRDNPSQAILLSNTSKCKNQCLQHIKKINAKNSLGPNLQAYGKFDGFLSNPINSNYWALPLKLVLSLVSECVWPPCVEAELALSPAWLSGTLGSPHSHHHSHQKTKISNWNYSKGK